jgi:hypothetical protein
MGNLLSRGVEAVPTLLYSFGPVFELEKFKSVRQRGDPAGILRSILTISTDLSRQVIPLPRPPTGKCCFICCNTIGAATDASAVGPLNDCATVANYLRRVGFTVYFILNPSDTQYLDLLKYFLSAETEYTFLYYNGIAQTIKAGPEKDDGEDEVLTFPNGNNVADDELAGVLETAGKPEGNKVIIVSESSHSGNIWNLRGTAFCGHQLPSGVLSIASRRERRDESDDTSAGHDDSGLFTFLLMRMLNDYQGLKLKELKTKMNRYMSKFMQFLIVTSTSDEMLEEPVIPAYVPPR